jgi:hypothetical protein
MHPSDCLSTADVLAVFTDKITARGGRVTDVFDDGLRLLARSVLPRVAEVRPRDRMQGGVAVKARGRDISVHPYLFREVCKNGAITAHVLDSRRVADLDLYDPQQASYLLGEAIDACAAEDVFTATIARLRTAAELEVNMALDLLPMIARSRVLRNHKMLAEIMGRFFRDNDRTRFGLMNAVTSLARDTRDPDDRWELEELGGDIGARLLPAPRPPKLPARATQPRELEFVGAS